MSHHHHHDHCHGDHCGHEGNHHHHHHADECCCCDHDHHQNEKYSDQLLELADCAWMEVLKEKIKDQIRATSSHHLDQLAKLVTETNHNRWKHKMEGKSNCEDFERSLKDMMHRDQQL